MMASFTTLNRHNLRLIRINLKAVCHNRPSVSLLSEFGFVHIFRFAPISLILRALHLTYSAKP